MIARINVQERITLLGNKLMRRLTLWGRDALLRIPPISSAGDELPLLVILNPGEVLNSVCERKELRRG